MLEEYASQSGSVNCYAGYGGLSMTAKSSIITPEIIMIAPYSPVAALYFKHQQGIHDFLAYGAIYIVVAYFDAAASVNRINLAPFTLPLFGFFFVSANYLVKSFGKQDLFKMFGNHGYGYCIAMSFASWLAYSVMYRPQMFSPR